MNIAFNALCITNRSGTGRYAYGLIDGFVQSGMDSIRLFVFIPSEFSIPIKWQQCKTIRFYSVPTSTAWQRIAWEQISLPSTLKRLNINVLHSPAFICPCILPDKIKHIITVHDLAFHSLPQTIPLKRRLYLQSMIKWSINCAEMILTDSKAVADEMKNVYKINKIIHSVHLGIDPSQFNPEPSGMDANILNHYQLSKPYYLMVGTIEPRKNMETVLQAYHHARKSGMQKELVIVGRYGWMIDKKLLHSDGISWLGHMDDDDLPTLYRHADALLSPSLYEGFDLPTVEALACGTPVISSDIPVHREVMENHSQYVPAMDIKAWMYAMINPKKGETPLSYQRCWVDVAIDTYKAYFNISNQ